MKLVEKLTRWLSVPALTPGRIWFAFAVAVVTDTVQLVVGPLGWFLVDEALDVIAMVLTTGALGFHMLLLPTFVIEFIPVADMLPTWTGCTAAVVMLRRKLPSQPPLLPPSGSAPGVDPPQEMPGFQAPKTPEMPGQK